VNVLSKALFARCLQFQKSERTGVDCCEVEEQNCPRSPHLQRRTAVCVYACRMLLYCKHYAAFPVSNGFGCAREGND
jgi:hypothetical protein